MEIEKSERLIRIKNLYPMNVFQERGRQDTQCLPGEHQEDECRGCAAEGRMDEGGCAWSIIFPAHLQEPQSVAVDRLAQFSREFPG